MPSRNTIREYDVPAYYHIYNRGAGGAVIFRDAQDKRKFISLLARYLDQQNTAYPTYAIELLAYCVMGNHFHLLVYQEMEPDEITNFMRSVSTAYSMYYNLRYKNRGHVFQGVFRAVRITKESYLAHISRYIHLNPETYVTYKWSSLPYFIGTPAPKWLQPERMLNMSPTRYKEFLEDYTDRRSLLKDIKAQLAID
jgi:putative transposase